MPKANLMIIDFHTHIFPSAICQNRKHFFPSEPAFELLYQSAKSRVIGAIELLDAMDENEVNKSVIFGFPWKNPETFRMHNDYIMEMIQKYPRRFAGLGCFDPSADQAVVESLSSREVSFPCFHLPPFFVMGVHSKACKSGPTR